MSDTEEPKNDNTDKPDEQSDKTTTAQPDPPKPTDTSEHAGYVRLEQLERYRAEIRREIEESRNEDRATINELKEQLKTANDYIEEQKKAIRDREESKGKESTIVVPPDQVMRPQVDQQSPNDRQMQEAGERKKQRLGWW